MALTPEPTTLPAGFASLADAAELINVHPKTIRNWDAKKLIGSQLFKRPEGGAPIKIYNVADIQREAGGQTGIRPRVEKARPRPGKPAPAPVPAVPAQTVNAAVPRKLLEVLDGMIGRLEELPKLLAAPVPRDVLTMDEAVALGYQKTWIRKLRKEGKLTEVGRGKISRFDLERLAGKK